MKKTTIFLILCAVTAALPVAARAQYADMYYHRVGDTIEWKAPNGFYNWWEFEQAFNENLAIDIGDGVLWRGDILADDSTVTLEYFYTPTPLKIIGIAGTGVKHPVNQPSNLDTGVTNEYYLIYDADTGGMTLLKQVPWKMADPYRILHLKAHSVTPGWEEGSGLDSCCWYHPVDHYIRIYEYYFDSAIWVTDSFYVGGSFFTRMTSQDTAKHYIAGRMWNNISIHNVCGSELQEYLYNNNRIYEYGCAPTGVHYAYKSPAKQNSYYDFNYSFATALWQYSRSSDIGLIYPIIEVDTTVPPAGMCVPVSNVEVMVTDSGCAMVTWDGFPNYTSVTLRYGPINLPVSAWTSVDVTELTMYQICDFNHDIPYYGVQLNALCDKQEMPWSEPVYFNTPSDTSSGGPESIASPTLLSAQTFLQPNPARDEVTVSSSFNLKRIELHDAAGILVYSELAAGHSTTIDVSFLRSGTYIVTIHTHDGITHKRLVVSR